MFYIHDWADRLTSRQGKREKQAPWQEHSGASFALSEGPGAHP